MDIHVLKMKSDNELISKAFYLARQCQAERALITSMAAEHTVFEYPDRFWSLIFGTGPEVLKSTIPPMFAVFITSVFTSDSWGQIIRWVGIKGPLIGLDLLLNKLFFNTEQSKNG
jgi:hypothetical protein